MYDIGFRPGTTGLDPGAVRGARTMRPNISTTAALGEARRGFREEVGQTRCVVYALTNYPLTATETRDPQTSCARGETAREAAQLQLPKYVQEELKFGRLEEGFLRVRCESCHAEKLVVRARRAHEGLHFHDIAQLLELLYKLRDQGTLS